MKPYRPSNGSEGMAFEAAFCDRCKHDDFDEDTGLGGCEIIANAMCYEASHPEYPKEWVVDSDDPIGKTARCTKFEAKP